MHKFFFIHRHLKPLTSKNGIMTSCVTFNVTQLATIPLWTSFKNLLFKLMLVVSGKKTIVTSLCSDSLPLAH